MNLLFMTTTLICAVGWIKNRLKARLNKIFKQGAKI